MLRLVAILCFPAVLWLLSTAAAQPKKPSKNNLPHVVVAVPLGIPAGIPTKVRVRGLKLDTVTEIRFLDPRATAKIVNKSKAPVPNKQEPNQVGDTQLEVEITLPPGMPASDAYFVVVTPLGKSSPHRLLVNGTLAPIAEKEPNNGFRQAQPVQLPQVIDGAINSPQDVDVFRFEGKAGQRIVCEVHAARHGSALDSILTLYTAQGRIVASNDDFNGSPDSHLELALPHDDTYYLNLGDAHDQGGPAHVYRLVIQPGK